MTFFQSLAVLFVAPLLSVGTITCVNAQALPQGHNFDRVLVGSLDPSAWNGITFLARARGQPANFAIRFATRSGYFLTEGPEIPDAVREVGPHAPDESYARLSWQVGPRSNLVTLEWSRLDETTVVGRLRAPAGYQLTLESYIPFSSVAADKSGQYWIDPKSKAIAGEHAFDGMPVSTAKFLSLIDTPPESSGSYPGLEALHQAVATTESVADSSAKTPSRNAAALQARFGESGVIRFVAVVGWNSDSISEKAHSLLHASVIDSRLDGARNAYEGTRPSISGLFDQATQVIGDNMFWNSVYAQDRDLVLPTLSRTWTRDGWGLGEWDGFFNALLTSHESREQTFATLRAVLLAQLDNGIIPNDIGSGATSPDRSEPPVGAYVVWKICQRYPDLEFLRWAYPRLKRWHESWMSDRGDGQPRRDGNRNGLLEWGSDRGSADSSGGRGFALQARWESGMDDSPMYDGTTYQPETYTLDLDDVGLNSLFALDAESLAGLADILGLKEDARTLRGQYEKTKVSVQSRLWNDRDGIFENRFWNGTFSPRLSPTNFYPMLAGIATHKQAERMVRAHLLNEKEFWGRYVVPTTPRDDPAFSDQFYWRGNIWAPTNYLTYQSLERYGYDAEASLFASKSYDLFHEDWQQHHYDNEQYHAWGGTGGGDRHYTWGALLYQIAAEQFIDSNPWDGLRFGMFAPAKSGQLLREPWNGGSYEIHVGPQETVVIRDGHERLSANAPVVVRRYMVTPDHLTLDVHTAAAADLLLGEIPSGLLQLDVDGIRQRTPTRTPRGIKVAIGAGKHHVVVGRQGDSFRAESPDSRFAGETKNTISEPILP